MPLCESARRGPRWPADVVAFEEEGPDAPRDLHRRDADGDDDDGARALRGGVHHDASLVAGERGGDRRAHRGPRHGPGVRPQARRDVEGHHRASRRVHRLDEARDGPADGAGEAGAEERVDDHVGALQLPREAGRARPIHLLQAAAQASQGPRGIAAHVAARAGQEDAHTGAAGPQVPGHDEAVAAVSPRPQRITTRRPRTGPNRSTMTRAAPAPAASMRRVPGMPSSLVARASSARISAAVKTGSTRRRRRGQPARSSTSMTWASA